MSASFLEKFDGRLAGILTWQAFDDLWRILAASGGEWYVYDLAGEVPTQPAADFNNALGIAAKMLADARKNSYCGAVYVDNAQAPEFVKVFDPLKMGTACGCSGQRILPRFVFSRLQPVALITKEPAEAPGFFAKMLGRR